MKYNIYKNADLVAFYESQTGDLKAADGTPIGLKGGDVLFGCLIEKYYVIAEPPKSALDIASKANRAEHTIQNQAKYLYDAFADESCPLHGISTFKQGRSAGKYIYCGLSSDFEVHAEGSNGSNALPPLVGQEVTDVPPKRTPFQNTDTPKLWSRAKSDKFVLLTGVGGAGKTTLLGHLENYLLTGQIGIVHRALLLKILASACRDFIADPVHEENDPGNVGMNNNYFLRYFYVEKLSDAKKRIFLLDGLNELFAACSDPASSTAAAQIIKELNLLVKSGAKVVITTRSAGDVKYFAQTPHVYRILPIENVTVTAADFSCPVTDAQIAAVKDLVSLPLYYVKFDEMKKGNKKFDGNDKYHLLLGFHKAAYTQAVAAPNPDRTLWCLMYFMIVPAIAKALEDRRKTSVTRGELNIVLETEFRKPYFMRAAETITTRTLGSVFPVQLGTPHSPDFYISRLADVEFIEYSDGAFSFTHQEWREYFAAFYTANFLTLGIRTEYNLPTAVQFLAADGAGLNKDSPDFTKRAREVFDRLDLEPATDSTSMLLQLERNIECMYMCYEYFDHFQLRDYTVRNDIFTKFFTDVFDNIYDYSLVLPRLSAQAQTGLSYVCSAMINKNRTLKDFAECRRYFEFAEKYTKSGSDKFARCMLKNQHAKALTFNAQFAEDNTAVSDWDDYLTVAELLNEGVKLLDENRIYNMSANNLGNILSCPTKLMLKYGYKRDVVKAAKVYYGSFADMTTGSVIRLGTERVFLVRQLVGLILKGYVRYDGQKFTAPDKAEYPDEKSLVFVDKLLSTVEYQHDDANFIDVLRGIYRIMRDHTNIAVTLFDMEKRNYLADIVCVLALGESGCKQYGVNYSAAQDNIRHMLTFFAERIATQKDSGAPDGYYLLLDAINIIEIFRYGKNIPDGYIRLGELLSTLDLTDCDQRKSEIITLCSTLPPLYCS